MNFIWVVTGVWTANQYLRPWRKCIPVPRNRQLLWGGVGLAEPPFCLWEGVDGPLLVQVITASVAWRVWWWWHAWKTELCNTPISSGFYIPYVSTSTMFPEPLMRWHRCPVYGWTSNSHLFSATWQIMNLWSSCCLLRKEYSLIKAGSNTNL